MMTEVIEIIEGCCNLSKKSTKGKGHVKAQVGEELKMPEQQKRFFDTPVANYESEVIQTTEPNRFHFQPSGEISNI